MVQKSFKIDIEKEIITMTNREKYLNAFIKALEITEEQTKDLTYTGIPEWDSVGHMALIAEIEETFDIMMDTEDIIDFSSYEKGMEILKEHYNVEF